MFLVTTALNTKHRLTIDDDMCVSFQKLCSHLGRTIGVSSNRLTEGLTVVDTLSPENTSTVLIYIFSNTNCDIYFHYISFYVSGVMKKYSHLDGNVSKQ